MARVFGRRWRIVHVNVELQKKTEKRNYFGAYISTGRSIQWQPKFGVGKLLTRRCSPLMISIMASSLMERPLVGLPVAIATYRAVHENRVLPYGDLRQAVLRECG